MQKGLLAEAALAALLWSSSARAQAPTAPPAGSARTATAAPSTLSVSPPEALPQTHWYGWQTLLVDGASLGVAIAGLATRPPHQDWSVVSDVGLGAWVVGAPIVHWVHRRTAVGFASLGLRVALPALGLLLLSTPCSSSECSEQVLAAFFGLTLIPAPIIVDACWLARERRMPAREQSAQSVVSFVPFIRAWGDRRMLGVSGRF